MRVPVLRDRGIRRLPLAVVAARARTGLRRRRGRWSAGVGLARTAGAATEG